jgi:hypothetical protein
LVGLLVAVLAAAALPALVRGASPSEAEQRIEEQLGAATDIEMTETPLSEFAAFLSQKHGIEVKLDHKALDDMGMGRDMPVTLNAKGIRLSSALDLALADLGLDWEVHSDVLRITTPSAAGERVETRLYVVRELVGDDPAEVQALADIVRSGVFLQPLPGEEAEESPLPRLHGKVTVFKNLLVVTAPYKSHRRLQSFLADFKAESAK